jgi:hyperosmotically inducible periplasmic protein
MTHPFSCSATPPHPPAVLLALALALAGCAMPQEIERTPPAEAELATEVKIALVEAPALAAAAIFVDAEGDLVRLGGFTGSAEEREQAERIAREVPGVARVENDIQVR